MKIFIFCALLALATGETISTIQNNQSFKDVVKCITNKQPCKLFEAEFKDAVITLLEEACARCDSEMKNLMKIFLKSFEKNAPKDYETFKSLYDPKNQNIELFEEK